MKEIEDKKVKPERKNLLNYIFLILAIFLIFNWLFNPRYGVFYDPCLTDAMTRDIMGFEGSKNEWVLYFSDSNKLHDMYNNGAVIGVNSCGYQWGNNSGEELFFFGPMVLIFSLFLFNAYSLGFKKAALGWNQKTQKDG